MVVQYCLDARCARLRIRRLSSGEPSGGCSPMIEDDGKELPEMTGMKVLDYAMFTHVKAMIITKSLCFVYGFKRACHIRC